MTGNSTALKLSLSSIVLLAAIGAVRAFDRPVDGPLDAPSDLAPIRSAESDPVSAEEARGQNEGVTVHGHWRIEVRDPDGSLADVREFENALVDDGGRTLARLVAGIAYVGELRIYLQNVQDQPCLLNGDGTPSACIITETSTAGHYFPNLTKTVAPYQSEGDDTLLLSGTATAQRDGSIATVGTGMDRLCVEDNGLAPEECGPNYVWGFTSTNITPIDVLTGQSILATVTLSFS